MYKDLCLCRRSSYCIVFLRWTLNPQCSSPHPQGGVLVSSGEPKKMLGGGGVTSVAGTSNPLGRVAPDLVASC